MIRSLLARLTLVQQLTALIAIVAFAALSLAITAHVLRAERRAFVTETANRLAGKFGDEFTEEPDTLAAAQSLVEDGTELGLQVEVRDAAGRVLASSRPSARTARGGTEARIGDVFVSTATNASGTHVTVVGARASERETISALARSLLIAALPILALGLLLGRGIAARALRPLSTMAERAASVSVEQNPRSLGSPSGLEEIDRLGRSFDHLLARLDDALLAERRLTADASHELRTPLTVLGGELELLLEQTPAGTAHALGLRRAAEQVGAMRELVEAILLLHRSRETGRAGGGAFEVLNLGDLLRETLAETRARYPGRERDITLAAPDEILLHGQGALLASALRNLLDNALKFTASGDRVRVEAIEEQGQAILTVDDAGPGIPESERERVFDPFFRGADARAGVGGVGLGLPILRRVARAHGGDVEGTASPLGGARFVLRLPVYRPVSPPGG